MKLHVRLLEKLRHTLDDIGLEVKSVDVTPDKGAIFTIETLANRGDHLYIYGVARELAARTLAQIKLPTLAARLTERKASLPIRRITDKCSRYALLEMSLPADMPLRNDVAAFVEEPGKHPAIVDILNYVQMEFGQPMHAFDADKIDGEIIIDTDELSVAGEGYVGKITIGNLELKGMRVGDMKVAYYWDGIASISGKGELYLDSAKEWGVGVALRGAANATDVSLGGDATMSLGIVKLGASAAVSTKGVIACGILKGLWFDDARLGLSKEWAEPAWRLRGNDCNTKEFEVPVAPVDGSTKTGSGRNASGADSGTDGFSVNVADGQKMVTFAIDAANESATVVGPDGMTIQVTGREQSTQSDPENPRWMVIHEPGDTVSYVVVGKPAGGTWKITTSGPATPKVSASVVDAKSEPKDARTTVLDPTLVGAPLTALPPSTDGSAGDDAPVLEIVLVLIALGAALAATLTVTRRRNAHTE